MTKDEHAPLGGRLVTGPFIFFLIIVFAATIVLSQRLVFGLGAATNLNDGYPWGIWIAIDLIIGTALGCGGLVMALLTYILNQGQYHPIVRVGLMTSLFGYTLGAIAVMIDLGVVVWRDIAGGDQILGKHAVARAARIDDLASDNAAHPLVEKPQRLGQRGQRSAKGGAVMRELCHSLRAARRMMTPSDKSNGNSIPKSAGMQRDKFVENGSPQRSGCVADRALPVARRDLDRQHRLGAAACTAISAKSSEYLSR
jgi:hypothetical protein